MTFSRFIFVGIINTLFSLMIFIIAFYQLKLNILASNVISYSFGILISYFLNSSITFKSKLNLHSFQRFIFVALFCYVLNLIVLYFFYNFILSIAWVSQLLSMCIYTIFFYNLSRLFVWTGEDVVKK